MWRATVHTPEQVTRFRERREETGIGSVVCHAVYLVNLASSDRELHARSVAAMRATLEAADAIGAEAVIFHPGSHLGARAGRRARAHRAGAARAPGADDRPALAAARRTAPAPVARSAARSTSWRRSSTRSIVTRDSVSASTRATGGPRASTSPHPATLDAAVAELDDRIGLDRLRCLHVNDAASALGSNLDRHASVGQGLMGSRLDVFLAHPAFQELPAILETPGPDGHGPDAEEVRRLRDLHRRGVRNARRRAARA